MTTVGPDTGYERRRRVEQLTRPDIKRHRSPTPRSLSDAITRGTAISRRELRALHQRRSGPVISLYLTLAPDPPEQAIPPLSAFHSMRHTEVALRKAYIDSLDRYARLRLDRDLEELEEVLDSVPGSGMRSLVVFKSGDELNRAVPLALRVRDRLVIAADPYVEPLEAVLDAYYRALVVSVERNGSQFWTHHLGHADGVHELRAEFPSDDAGRSHAATADRKRETHLHWHLRSTIQAMTSLMTEYECDVSVIAGDEELTAELERLLPDALRATLAGTIHPDEQGLGKDRAALVDRVLGEYRDRVETGALDELGRFSAHGLLVSGLPDVLEAVDEFRVRRLFLSDALAPGFHCREHHFLALAGGRCPFDDSELLPTENVVDELVEFTQQHGVDVMLVVCRKDMLESHGGVAGVLYPPAP